VRVCGSCHLFFSVLPGGPGVVCVYLRSPLCASPANGEPVRGRGANRRASRKGHPG
jgi:hypothetical protein